MPFLSIQIDPSENKSAAKTIHFFALTLLQFCEAHGAILECSNKLRLCAFTLIRISVNIFTNMEVFLPRRGGGNFHIWSNGYLPPIRMGLSPRKFLNMGRKI